MTKCESCDKELIVHDKEDALNCLLDLSNKVKTVKELIEGHEKSMKEFKKKKV